MAKSHSDVIGSVWFRGHLYKSPGNYLLKSQPITVKGATKSEVCLAITTSTKNDLSGILKHLAGY